jgi:glycosyltransferase involved in cell wall biosynthesis
MNILIISHMFPNKRNPVHGIFVYKQAEALAKIGHEVTVVAPLPWAPWPLSLLRREWTTLAETPSHERIDTMEVFRPRYIAFPRALLFCSSGDRLRSSLDSLLSKELANREFDLIHSHVGIPDGYAGIYLAARMQCPHIVTVHGQDFHLTAGKSRECRNKLHRVLSSSSRVVTVSSKLARLGAELYPDIAEKIVVLPNGVDPKEIDEARRHPASVTNGKPLIVSVSNLVPTKGIDINLRALSSLLGNMPELTYVIVGDGPERSRLEQLARELGISSNVRFLGQLDHAAALKHVAAADIFVLPSWQEGFGVVYLEAMALGKPVIACSGEGPADFINDGKTGFLVPPRDIESVARLARRLAENEQERRSVGQRASQFVLANFTWMAVARKLSELYKEIVDERKAH